MAVLPPDPVFSLRCPEMGGVNSLCFHQNERLLAGTIKGSVYLFDLQTNRSALHFEIGSQPITSLHHAPDMLVSQEKGGRVTLWSMSNSGYVRQHTVDAQHLGFCRTVLHPHPNIDDQQLFYPCQENTIGVLRLNDPEAPPQMLVPDDPQLPKLGSVTCFKPLELASQQFLLAGYESGALLTWDLSSGVVVDVLQLDPDVMALDYDAQINRAIVGGPTNRLQAVVYQRQTMQLQMGAHLIIKNPGVNCIRIRPDKKIFASGGWDGRVRIYSWRSLRTLAVLTEHKSGGIMDIAFSDAKVSMWSAPIMACAGQDGQISLWDLYN